MVNTSATIPAALPVALPGGKQGKLHVSTKVDNRQWLIEIREITGNKTIRWHEGQEGMAFLLPSGAGVTLKERFYKNNQWLHLWVAEFDIRQPMQAYLSANARPIQYEKLRSPISIVLLPDFLFFSPWQFRNAFCRQGIYSPVNRKLVKKRGNNGSHYFTYRCIKP